MHHVHPTRTIALDPRFTLQQLQQQMAPPRTVDPRHPQDHHRQSPRLPLLQQPSLGLHQHPTRLRPRFGRRVLIHPTPVRLPVHTRAADVDVPRHPAPRKTLHHMPGPIPIHLPVNLRPAPRRRHRVDHDVPSTRPRLHVVTIRDVPLEQSNAARRQFTVHIRSPTYPRHRVPGRDQPLPDGHPQVTAANDQDPHALQTTAATGPGQPPNQP